DPDAAVLDYFADMKFALQVYEVETRLESGAIGDRWADDAISRFEAVYSELYGEGTSYRAAGVVLTALRVTVREPSTDRARLVASHAEGTPVAPGTRSVYWRELGERRPTPIPDGTTLTPGTAASGPAGI